MHQPSIQLMEYLWFLLGWACFQISLLYCCMSPDTTIKFEKKILNVRVLINWMHKSNKLIESVPNYFVIKIPLSHNGVLSQLHLGQPHLVRNVSQHHSYIRCDKLPQQQVGKYLGNFSQDWNSTSLDIITTTGDKSQTLLSTEVWTTLLPFLYTKKIRVICCAVFFLVSDLLEQQCKLGIIAKSLDMINLRKKTLRRRKTWDNRCKFYVRKIHRLSSKATD